MNQKLFFIFICAVLKTSLSFAQSNFSKIIGITNGPYSCVQNTDSTYTMISVNGQFGRLDRSGSPMLSYKSDFGNLFLRVFDLEETADSGFILSGTITDLQQFNRPIIAKTSSQGQMQWVKYIEADYLDVVQSLNVVSSDRGILSCINSIDTVSSKQIVTFVKTDSSGLLKWSRKIQCLTDCHVSDIALSRNNSLVMVGTRDTHTLISKLDSSGNISWSRTINDTNSVAERVIALSDGSFLLSGYRHNTNANRIYMAKIDSFGNLIWYNIYNNALYDFAFNMLERSNRDILVVGEVNNFESGSLLCVDSFGIPKFARKYVTDTSLPSTVINSVFESNDDSLILFGGAKFDSLIANPFIFKVDSTGDGNCIANADTFYLETSNYSFLPDTFVSINQIVRLYPVQFTSNQESFINADFCISSTVSSVQDYSFSIYPNPVTDHLSISIPTDFTVGMLEIYNSVGQKIFTKQIEAKDAAELSFPVSFHAGKYYGRFVDKQQTFSFSFTVIE